MGTITSSTGLVSGINTGAIIDQLMQIEGKQKDLVQAKIDDATTQKTAYLDLSTRLTSLQISAQSLSKPSFFANAAATSSDESVLTATATNGAAVGSYQFQVARLTQSQQLVTSGFASTTSTVGAGKITVELGGGGLTQNNPLSDLRGGEGISRGEIRITDSSGKTSLLDLSSAVDLNDIVNKINTDLDVSVNAKVQNNKLVITDTSGGAAGTLKIQDVGNTTTAADLGITGTAVSGVVTSAASLQYVGRNTTLASLNDGNGVANATGSDLTIKTRNGTTYAIDLGQSTTIGGVIDAINKTTGGKVTASINADGTGLKLVDSTTGGGAFSVTSPNGSTTAADLGIDGAASGGQIDGSPVQAQLNTVLLKTLSGGAGITLGQIKITARSGTSTPVDLSGAKTVQDVLDTINSSNAGVTASLNSAGNGIALADTSGGTGNLVVDDVTGTGAEQLGLKGTFDTSQTLVQGANLQRKWVSGGTTLANYNGGAGVNSGTFKITSSSGTTAEVSIDNTKDLTMADVIAKINAAGAVKQKDGTTKQTFTASINANGDGLLVTDNTAGASKFTIADEGGSTAANLNIAGRGTSTTVNGVTTTTINGSEERTIDVASTDTLTDVQNKINNLTGGGLSATIMNDGSGAAPYRLSLTSKNSGLAGQVIFDAGTTDLQTRTLVKAQDAAVFVGASDGSQPLLVTSNRNTISNVVKGVSLTLNSTSKEPVTVSVANDVTNVTDALTQFTKTYNDLLTKIDVYTEFVAAASDPNATTTDPTDPNNPNNSSSGKITPPAGTKQVNVNGTTYNEGVLLGDYSVQQIQDQMASILQTVVPQAGKYKMLESVGVSVNQDGSLNFDTDKFNNSYADDPDSVKTLFTNTSNAITSTTQLKYLNGGSGIATAGDDVDDFIATTADGTKLNVSIGTANTVQDIISSINAAGKGKLTAALTQDKKIQLTDTTTGTKSLTLLQQNGSQFLANLGLTTTSSAGKISSKTLISSDPLASTTGGIGVNLQQKINKLIDPVDGLITSESSTLDNKITQYQGRISDLNTILDNKRQVLEDQFNNMETVLAKLQSQQSSLGQIRSISQ